MTYLRPDLMASAFTWIWQTSVAVTVLAALLYALDHLLRPVLSVSCRYWLWALVVARLLVPSTPASVTSVFNLTRYLPAKVESDKPDLTPGQLEHESEGTGAPGTSRATQALPSFDAPLRPPTAADARSRLWGNMLPLGWLTGAVAFLMVVGWQHVRLSTWMRRQPAVSDARLIALLAEARALIGVKRSTPIDIVLTGYLSTPAVFGFWRPRLLLPRTLLQTLGEQELRLVLLHELVHVRRGDVAMNWLLIVLQALHWFNPAVWFAFRRLRAAREMVCDAVVLQRLAPEERRRYGQTLIKLLDVLARGPVSAGLLPILNQKTEIQRRIVMISTYRPSRRFSGAAAAAVLAALACLTFTRAADNPVAPPKKEAPAETRAKATPAATRAAEVTRAMEVQLDQLNDLIHSRQAQLDSEQERLGIPGYVANRSGPDGADAAGSSLRKLEALRIDAQATAQEAKMLYDSLKELPRNDLKKSLTMAAPDAQLSALQESLAVSIQKAAVLEHSVSAEHPEMKSMRNIMKVINKQIDDRMDGIMAGLRARHLASQTRLKDLETEYVKARESEIQQTIVWRRYFDKKREIDNLLQVRDRLQIRLLEQKIDAKIPKENIGNELPAGR